MGKYYGVAMSEYDKNCLEHFGIKGQRWGVRRYQNEDGTLTEEGKKRYTYSFGREGESRMSLAGRIKFGNKYANEYNASHKMSKEQKKEYDDKVREEDKKSTEFDEKLRDINKRAKSFDKLTGDEQFALVDEINKAQNELIDQGKWQTEEFNAINHMFHELRYEAGRTRFKEYDNMPKGEKRDKALTQLLADSQEQGQDSDYREALIDKMQETSGDFLSRKFKSESARKAAEAVDSANEESEEITNRYYQQDQKLGKYPKDKYGSGFFHEDRLANDHPEVKAAVEKREAAWEKYCEQVLKDMGMPVNSDTIEYIQSVIIWN